MTCARERTLRLERRFRRRAPSPLPDANESLLFPADRDAAACCRRPSAAPPAERATLLIKENVMTRASLSYQREDGGVVRSIARERFLCVRVCVEAASN